MSEPRRYPDEPAGPFEPPPRTFVDNRGREITLGQFGEYLDEANAECRALVEMYDRFDSADRAQGIPPSEREGIHSWLDRLFAEGAVNVLAWDGDIVAGHAMLVPDDEGSYELAIFVHQDYQAAGIGTELIRSLLGAGAADRIEYVWLTVERWNRPAIELYHGVGFETTNARSFEMEMAIRLAGRPG